LKEWKLNKEINVTIKSEEQYLAILNSLTDPMHIIDREYNIQFLNLAMVLWLNKLNLNSDLVGKTLFEEFSFLEYDKIHNEYKKVFKTGELLITKEATKLANGILFTETLKIPVRSNGKVEQVITIMRDITEQKEAEEKLKASEERYKNIISNLMDIIIILDLKGNFLYVSPQIYDITGFKQEEIIGKNGFKLMHPNDINKAASVLKEAIEQKKRMYIEYRTIHKQGHYIDVSASGRIVNIEGKDRIFAVVRDISEHKISKQKLTESEEKYRLITENANDMIAILNDKMEYEYVNEAAFLNIMGRTKDDLIGYNSLRWAHPDDIEKSLNAFKEGWEKGEAITKARFRDTQENYHLLEVKGKLITDHKGEKKVLIVSRDISERKKAEQKLKDSEEKFRTIAEQSFLGIAILQNDIIIYVNEQLANKFGYTAEEIMKWGVGGFMKVIYPDDRKMVAEQAKKKQSGEPDVVNQYQFRGIKKDGDIIWSEIFSKTINYKGKPADFVTIHDITEEKLAEQKLIESEVKFRTIAEQSFMGILILQDGVFKYFNDQASKLNGYSMEEIRNWEPYEFQKLIYPEDREFVMEQVRKKQAGDPDVVNNYQYRIVKKNGEVIWVDNYSKSINYKGKTADFVMTFDISDKIKAEKKIRESEENFRTIAEQAFMGTLIIQNDQVAYVNDALLQIFEFSQSEVDYWKKDDLLKLIHPEDLEYLRDYREQLRSGEFDIKPYYSYRVFTKYGKIKWIDQFSRPIIYRGKPAELITIMDITEKKKAEQELVKLNSLKSELLRRTSHELKTPLVSIKGFSDLLLTVHKEKLDDYVLATIHEIKLGCERLESLIQDILKTSELEAESVELKKSEEDLSFLIKLCIKELQGLTRLRNHEVSTDIHDKLITSFEPDQIHLVISNLLNNAIKYTPPNGKIEVKSAITDNSILISIHDNGIGITNEEKKRLFSQFGKIERYGQGLDIISDGSGLGLYITKRIVELHGGKIGVKSKGRNKGSTFYFTLPLTNEK